MEFKIKEFVSTESKVDLIGLSIQEATVEGIINPMVLDIAFNVNKILVYTDINVPLEEKINKFVLYDRFIQEGVIEQFEKEMKKEELDMLEDYLSLWTRETNKYMNSLRGLVDSVKLYLETVGKELDLDLSVLKDVDLSQLKNLIPLSKELGIDLEK